MKVKLGNLIFLLHLNSCIREYGTLKPECVAWLVFRLLPGFESLFLSFSPSFLPSSITLGVSHVGNTGKWVHCHQLPDSGSQRTRNNRRTAVETCLDGAFESPLQKSSYKQPLVSGWSFYILITDRCH